MQNSFASGQFYQAPDADCSYSIYDKDGQGSRGRFDVSVLQGKARVHERVLQRMRRAIVRKDVSEICRLAEVGHTELARDHNDG